MAREIILEGRGSHFDPDIVDAFMENEDRFVEILERFSACEDLESSLLLHPQAELALSS